MEWVVMSVDFFVWVGYRYGELGKYRVVRG